MTKLSNLAVMTVKNMFMKHVYVINFYILLLTWLSTLGYASSSHASWHILDTDSNDNSSK